LGLALTREWLEMQAAAQRRAMATDNHDSATRDTAEN
jgi:hypothetical protein